VSVPGLNSGVPNSIGGALWGYTRTVNVDTGTKDVGEPEGKATVFSGIAHERPPQEVVHPPYGGPVRLRGANP
jgi:hypothetical protein